MAHAGIYAYVAIPKPPLTQVHKEKRLEWAELVMTFDDDELKTIEQGGDVFGQKAVGSPQTGLKDG